MSETSETMGRCRSEVDDCYGSLPLVAIADAIDRLAEDVAAVKAAILPQTTEERDAAIRERDEARALLELAQVQRTAAYADRDQARAEVYQLKCSRTETSKERDEALAEVERLRAELAARPAANSPGISDSSPAVTEPAAPEPAYYLVTNERDMPIHVSRMHPGVGWDGCTIAALYAAPQAAAPPVVEVPAMRQPGPMTIREKHIHVAYRAAIDKAGVKWREVGRE